MKHCYFLMVYIYFEAKKLLKWSAFLFKSASNLFFITSGNLSHLLKYFNHNSQMNVECFLWTYYHTMKLDYTFEFFSDGLLVISNWNQFYESSRIKAFRFYLFLMNQKTNMDVFCSFGRKELGNHNHSQNVWDKLYIVFMGNSTLQEKFNFYFSEDFCWYCQFFFS